jgi:hypothetical protein
MRFSADPISASAGLAHTAPRLSRALALGTAVASVLVMVLPTGADGPRMAYDWPRCPQAVAVDEWTA